MKVFKILAALLLILFVILAAVPAALSSSYEVSRSTTIQASANEIHPWVEDLKLWPEWSAWNKERFPDLSYEYSGTDKGVGAVSSWKSAEAGNGTMTITASEPEKGVWYDLSFDGMYESKGVVTYAESANGTTVAFVMRGDLDYFARYFGLVMDSMMGPDFEAGLSKLKTISEKGPPESAAAPASSSGSAEASKD